MRLSIIIPAINEASNIVQSLDSLQAIRAHGVEVILADGGSTDRTIECAAPLVDRIVASERGRAKQMNAGAAVAQGDVLLFLHADSILPADADRAIASALSNENGIWGRFDIAISGRHFMLPHIAWFMNQRSRVTGIATGDQGLFAARAAFETIGGFPDQPLMEDIEFCRRMKRLALPVCLSKRIITSGRRWEQHGVWTTIGLMWWLRLRYWAGASPAELHRVYYAK